MLDIVGLLYINQDINWVCPNWITNKGMHSGVHQFYQGGFNLHFILVHLGALIEALSVPLGVYPSSPKCADGCTCVKCSEHGYTFLFNFGFAQHCR